MASPQPKGARGEKGEKKKKKVKLSQEEIDVFMEMSPPRPFPRFDLEEILQMDDPDDPGWLEIGLELYEISERCVPACQAWQEKKASIREQFLTKGEAYIEVTDDEAE